jgi:transcription antitermination factor NusG
MIPQWYALVVRSNRAFKIRDRLQELGIQEFLPTFTETIQWSDRVKTTERQLFPGYLFAKLNGDASSALNLPGVIQLLPSNIKPTSIDDQEISSLRTIIASQVPVQPCVYVAAQKVTIRSGPFEGVSGVVIRTRGAVQVIVGIEALGKAVKLTVDAADLEKAA